VSPKFVPVLESVAKEAVEADVRRPNAREAQKAVDVQCSSESGQRCRPQVAVPGVVASRTDATAHEVTEHREIGEKK
jgi:hypothetical protein